MYRRIRNLREDKDLTQAQMAARLNIHQTTYSDYELGNLNIPVPVLDKLACFFETSIDYLVERTDVKEPYPPKRERDDQQARARLSGPVESQVHESDQGDRFRP